MIHSKNNSYGFTLLEALLAISVVAMILTPLLLNQIKLLTRVVFQAQQIAHTFSAEQFMIDSYVQFILDNKKLKNTKTTDDTELNFSITKGNPTISKEFRSVYAQKVTAQWEYDDTTYKSSLVTFLFLPELEEKT